MNRKKIVPTTVKKTAKKAVKKTYPKKKTAPKPRRITLDDLAAVVADTDARMARAREETERAFRETDKAIRKSREETERVLRELSDEVQRVTSNIERVTSNLESSYGGVSLRLGKLTELIVVPKLRHNMNAQGHNFNQSEPDTLVRGIVGNRKEGVAQVDMLLRGPSEAMAVEIKTRLKESSVRDHLERLQDLRDHEDEAGIKGKKLFGAVVGVTIDDVAKKIAKENGLYIVKIHEQEGELDIERPEICQTW
jgi:hypothetical protein